MTDIHNADATVTVACDFMLGDKVITVAETRHGDVVVPSGETGTIIDVDPDGMTIKLDRYIADLDHVRNLICLRSNAVEYLF
jgi:hypothetical protein